MSLSTTALRLFVGEMPKAELHVHLDGALRIGTALRLAAERGIPAPTTFAAMAQALVAPDDPGTEADVLAHFELPVRLMQDADALAVVTRELIEAKAADGVRYLEIKWAPILHTRAGLRVEDVLEAVCVAADVASRASGTVVRLVPVAVRSQPIADAVALAEAAVAWRDRGVAGFDLAGSEAEWPDPRPFAPAFDVARRSGLGITLHAGDLPGRSDLVRLALDLRPHRIAHGVAAADDPELCELLRERSVTLDLCPTSNVQSGSVTGLAAHPVARLHRAGVPVTISTDDPTISAVTLARELVRTAEATGLRADELWAINLRALDAAFAPPEVIGPLRDEFRAWARAIPDIARGYPASTWRTACVRCPGMG